MELWLIRHAKVEGLEDVLKGSGLDPELSFEGYAQALDLCHGLKQFKLDAVYSSPLLRAGGTAEPLAQGRSLPVLFRPGLREIDVGTFTGKPITEDPRCISGNWDFDFSPYGGESDEQFQDRVKHELEYFRQHHSKDAVAAISHAGVIRKVRQIQGMPPLLEIPHISFYHFSL